VPSVTASPSSGLDLYDIAWLAGGRGRALLTAVVALVENARLQVADPTGELKVLVREADHPVEVAVLDAVGTHAHRGLETIDVLIGTDPRLAAVPDRLAAIGLLAARGRRSRLRRGRRSWLRRVRPVPRTRAGRRTLEGLRKQAGSGSRFGGTAAAQVALHGPERLPAGLPPALADGSGEARWSWTRPVPRETREAAVYPGDWGGLSGAGGGV
jgi:hypothetical protein